MKTFHRTAALMIKARYSQFIKINIFFITRVYDLTSRILDMLQCSAVLYISFKSACGFSYIDIDIDIDIDNLFPKHPYSAIL